MRCLIDILILLSFLLLFTYIFIKVLINENGVYKVKAILIWIVLYDLNCIFNIGNPSIKLSNMDIWFLIIGLILGCVYSFMSIMRSKDIPWKISIEFTCLYIFLAFCASALEAQNILLLYIFKVMLMLTLLMGLIALKDIHIFLQIVVAFVLYIIAIGMNIMLSTQFYSLPEDEMLSGIYMILQRSYSLISVNEQMSAVDIKMYIGDFIICKIMDVILLGFISARFMKIVEESKSCIKYSEES